VKLKTWNYYVPAKKNYDWNKYVVDRFYPKKKRNSFAAWCNISKIIYSLFVPDCLVNHNRDDELLVLAIYQNEQKYAIDLINGKHIRLYL